jgi:hypothetical protein
MQSFSVAHNVRSWDKTGYFPFTRRLYWDLKKEEDDVARSAQARGSSEALVFSMNDLLPEEENPVFDAAVASGTIPKSHMWQLGMGVTSSKGIEIATAAANKRDNKKAAKLEHAATAATIKLEAEAGYRARAPAVLDRIRAGGTDLWNPRATLGVKKPDLVALLYTVLGTAPKLALTYAQLKSEVEKLPLATLNLPPAPLLLTAPPAAGGGEGGPMGPPEGGLAADSDHADSDGDGSEGDG